MQLVFRSQCKTLILQHSYVMRLIKESGFTPVTIHVESASLVVFCFLLNPCLFRRGETSGHDLSQVCLLFLLPPVYSTMYSAVLLTELQMSLGLASRGLLHDTGLCHCPSSSRCGYLASSYTAARRHIAQSSLLLCVQRGAIYALKVKVFMLTQCA